MCEINARVACRAIVGATPGPPQTNVECSLGEALRGAKQTLVFVNAAAFQSCQHCAGGERGAMFGRVRVRVRERFFAHTGIDHVLFQTLFPPPVHSERVVHSVVHVRSRSATLCFGTRDVPDENGRCFAQR